MHFTVEWALSVFERKVKQFDINEATGTQFDYALGLLVLFLVGAAFVFSAGRRLRRKKQHSGASGTLVASNEAPRAVAASRWKPETIVYPLGGAAPGDRRGRLVLFIHGILGSEATSFGRFPDLLRNDPDISAQYDVAAFNYRTALTAPGGAHLSEVARELKTVIDHRLSDYSEIVILAHSMGGLVTRRYIADVLMAHQPLRVSRVIYFATPHMGALAAKLGSIITSCAIAATRAAGAILLGPSAGTIAATAGAILKPSEQLTALGYDSRFLQDLMLDEASCGASERIWAKFVVAAHDRWVGTTSAWGPGGPTDFEVVPDTDHSSLVKPQSNKDLSFLIAQHVLLFADARAPWAAEPDFHQPDLKRKVFDQQTPAERERNRFVYWNLALPFIGRDREEQVLAAFLGDPQRRFRWLLISGAGGMGKSRLALELVLAQTSGWWNAGFLDPEQKLAPDWALWQPRLPTLMIVDYAGRKPDLIASMLKGLAEREPPNLLRYPVRVILIERNAKGPWLDVITRASRLVAGETARSDLALEPIADVWPIFEHVLGEDRAATAGRDMTLKRLCEIDQDQRPLFAHLMADAMRNGRDVRRWDRTALLSDVIERERHHFWLPAARLTGLGDRPVDILKEERALALATMVGTTAVPLTRSELKSCWSPLLPAWDVDRHPLMFAAMTGTDAVNVIRPLEPDIIGEFFSLEALSNLSDTDATSLIQLAWHIRPDQASRFVSSCAADFLDHRRFPVTYAIKPETLLIAKNWVNAAFDLILALRESNVQEAQRLHREMKALAVAHDATEPMLLQVWGAAACNLIIVLRRISPSEAQRLHGEMKALAEKYSAYPKLREYWADAAWALISHFCSSDMEEAYRLHREMKELAETHSDEPKLRECWAMAADTLFYALRGKKTTPAAAHTELTLREYWAIISSKLVTDLRSSKLKEVQRLHREMKELAETRSDEPMLRECWAKITYDLGKDLRSYDLNEARRLHREMKAPAEMPSAEAKLREYWAMGADNLINVIGANNMLEAQQLHDEMKAFAQTYSAEPRLRQLWAEAGLILIFYFRSFNMQEGLRLLGKIESLAEKFPEDDVLQEAFRSAKQLLCDVEIMRPIWGLNLRERKTIYLCIYQLVSQRAGSISTDFVEAFAAVLAKAAEEGVVERTLKDIELPPPEVALAARLLTLLRGNRKEEASAELASIKADWPANISARVGELLATFGQGWVN